MTIADRAVFSRSAGSSRPRITDCFTGARAPATETGSVSTSVARLTALSGPITSTALGSADSGPTTKPGAGRPSTAGTIGTSRDADGSNAIVTADGSTCTISTPNGTRT